MGKLTTNGQVKNARMTIKVIRKEGPVEYYRVGFPWYEMAWFKVKDWWDKWRT